MKPEELQNCFINWMQAVEEATNEIVAVDGKTLRDSYDKKKRKASIHMVRLKKLTKDTAVLKLGAIG